MHILEPYWSAGISARMSAEREQVGRAAECYMKRSKAQSDFAVLAARCLCNGCPQLMVKVGSINISCLTARSSRVVYNARQYS